MMKCRINIMIMLICLCILSACGKEAPLANQEGLPSDETVIEDVIEGVSEGTDSEIDLVYTEPNDIEMDVQMENVEEIEISPQESFYLPTEWTMIHDTFDKMKTESHIGRTLGSFAELGYNCNIDLSLVIESGQMMDGIVLSYGDEEKFSVTVMNIADASQAASECYIISARFRAGEYGGEMYPGAYALGTPVRAQLRKQFGTPIEESEQYLVYDAVASEVSMFFWFSELKQRYQLSEKIICRLEFDQQVLTEIRFEDPKLIYRYEESADAPVNQYEDMTPSVMEVLEPLE